jgi:GTPase Era involved in 16S rRNA processing
MTSEFTNINICLVGCVSAGKSTILNAFFGQDYAQCKIKRTTMMPNKFIETIDRKQINSFDSINSTISEVNKQIYKQTELGSNLSLADYGTELTFYVEPMQMNIGSNKEKKSTYQICIYDIPGLNDARTKTIYYDYLKNNFHKFNIILFVVDIHSGLNTSDEMDILNFLATNIKKHKTTSQKNITLLTVVNKADDMQLDGDNLEVLGELGEMFDQTSNTVKQVFIKQNISSNLVGCIPICGLDAHLYRMIKKFKDINKLTDENILRIGINEEGSKFRKYSKDQQRSKVQSKLSDTEFVDDMIKLSGFSQIEKALDSFIKLNGKSMVTENTFYEYKKLPEITLDNMIDNLKIRFKLLLPLSEIDDATYSAEMSKVVKQINTLVYKKINQMTNLLHIKGFYDNDFIKPIIEDKVIKREISDFFDLNIYPSYLTDRILELICVECSEKQITLSIFVLYIKMLEDIGIFDNKVIDLLFTSLMANPKYTQTITFDQVSGFIIGEGVMSFLEKLKTHENFIVFLRFFIANYICSSCENNHVELTHILMFLTKNKELPLRQFIKDFRVEKGRCSIIKNKQAYFSNNQMSCDSNILLTYYIEKCKENALSTDSDFVN